jgi:PAS domain-containing protein
LFIAIVRDITERKQSQETLLKQAQLLDLANDTIMVRDLNDTIAYWNQGAQRLYGWTSAEAVGQSVHSLLKTEFPQPLEEIKERLFQDGYWNGELVHSPTGWYPCYRCQRLDIAAGRDRGASGLPGNQSRYH